MGVKALVSANVYPPPPTPSHQAYPYPQVSSSVVQPLQAVPKSPHRLESLCHQRLCKSTTSWLVGNAQPRVERKINCNFHEIIDKIEPLANVFPGVLCVSAVKEIHRRDAEKDGGQGCGARTDPAAGRRCRPESSEESRAARGRLQAVGAARLAAIKAAAQAVPGPLFLLLLGGRGGFRFAHAALFAAGRAFLGFTAGVDGGAALFTGKDRHG